MLFKCFPSCMRRVHTAILSSNSKNDNSIFMISEIQTMGKLNNSTATSFPGFSLTVFRFNLFDSMVISF